MVNEKYPYTNNIIHWMNKIYEGKCPEYRYHEQTDFSIIFYTFHSAVRMQEKNKDQFITSKFDHKIYGHVSFKMWKRKSLVKCHSSVSVAFIFGDHNLNLPLLSIPLDG